MKDWKPQKSILISLSDETSEERTPGDLKQLLRTIREVCGEHGFDVSFWGSEKNVKKFIDKKYQDLKVRLVEED